MKKIKSIIFIILLVTLIVIIGNLIENLCETTELKKLNYNESRVVSTHLMSDKEKKLLDSNLKRNTNVLLLYYETDEEVTEEKERLIIGNYTKEEIPYVIFAYSPDNQTLKTVSSDKGILEFTDISIENVTSYTEVYKYIYGIESKLMVPRVSQNMGDLIIYIFVSIILYIILVVIMDILVKRLKFCVHWKRKDGFLFKEGFWERGYKVKFDPNDKEVIAIYANVPVKKGKDYLYIPKNDRKENKKYVILIETKNYFCRYTAIDPYDDVDFYKGIEWEKDRSLNDCVIEKLKSEFKYRIENKKEQ